MQEQYQLHEPAPRPGFWRRNRILWIILLAVPLVVPWGIFLVWQAGVSQPSQPEPVSYNLFLNEVTSNNVVSVTLTDQSVVGTFKRPVASDEQSGQTGTKFSTIIPNLSAENPVPLLHQHGVKINVQPDNSNSLGLTLLLQWGPFILLLVIIYLIVIGCVALYFLGRFPPPAARTPA